VLDYQSINIFQKAFQALLKGSLHSSPVVQLLVPENLDMTLVRSRLHVGIKSKKRGLVFFYEHYKRVKVVLCRQSIWTTIILLGFCSQKFCVVHWVSVARSVVLCIFEVPSLFFISIYTTFISTTMNLEEHLHASCLLMVHVVKIVCPPKSLMKSTTPRFISHLHQFTPSPIIFTDDICYLSCL